MASGTVMVIVGGALLCAALALAVALAATIASLVDLLPARISSAGGHDRHASRHAAAPPGNVRGRRA